MKKFNWLFLFLFSFAFVACDDDDEVVLDTISPTIMITNPTPNSEFAAGDEFQLTANITDNEGLEEVRAYVTGPDGNRISQYDDEVRDFLNDNRNYELEVDYTLPTDAATGIYTITVEAEDEAGNIAQQTVTMNVNVANLDRAGFNDTFGSTAWYANWDTDNDTYLNENEFGASFYQTWDRNGDGMITQAEWNEVAEDFDMEDDDWDDWDTDNNGSLNQQELNTGLNASGWYTQWDLDNDGTISQEEYTSGIFDLWDDDNDDMLTGDEYSDRYNTYYME